MMWNGFDIFSILLIPNVAMLPILWFYALALSRGLAFARDDQHRLVPLSPWALFWMGGRRWFGRLLLYGALGWPIISPFIWGNLLLSLLDAGLPAQYLPFDAWNMPYLLEDIASSKSLEIHLIVSLHALSALCPVLAGMTLLAPRMKGHRPLVMIAVVLLTSFLWLYAEVLDYLMWTDAAIAVIGFFAFLNALVFAVALLRARYVLNCRWFRFPEG